MSTSAYICVVDDDPDIREVLRATLEASGYRVAVASNGADALARLRSEPDCGLVLLDLMMPEMSGWDFRAAQELDPRIASIPVLVLSGVYPLPQQARDLHAASVLQKPVDVDVLMAEIARCFRGLGDRPVVGRPTAGPGLRR